MVFKTRLIHGIEEVKGERLKRVKEKYDIDCFIYRGHKETYKNGKPVIIKQWFVVEYQTGIAITGDETKDAALKRFEDWIQQDENNIKRLNKLIEEKTKEWGVINHD